MKALIRFALRTNRRHLGGTVTIAAVLGLGLGVVTIVFAAVDEILLDPEPLRGFVTPEELVAVESVHPRFGRMPLPASAFQFLRETARIGDIAGTTIVSGVVRGDDVPPQRVLVGLATPNWLQTLGLAAAPGTAADGSAEATGTPAVLGHHWWTSRLGSDPDVVGKDLVINERVVTIVGVAPPSLRHTVWFGGAALWVPLESSDWLWPGGARDNLQMQTFVRARADERSTLPQQLAAAAADYAQLGKDRSLVRWEARPLAAAQDPLGVPVQAGILIAVSAYLVLALVTANATMVLLARWAGRRHETAVRRAIGASKSQVLREFLGESVCVGFMAAGVGLAVAIAFREMFFALGPIPNASEMYSLDLWGKPSLVLVASALVASVFAAILPSSWVLSRNWVGRVVGASSTRTSGDRVSRRLAQATLVAQVAVAVILVAASGLFVRSEWNLLAVNPGIDTEQILTFSVAPTAQGLSPDESAEYVRRLADVLSSRPEVTAVGLGTKRLTTARGAVYMQIGPVAEDDAQHRTLVHHTTSSYFDAVGLRLTTGRLFGAGASSEVLINEALVGRLGLLPRTALGAALRVGEQTMQVVGVVEDSLQLQLGEAPVPAAFLNYDASASRSATVYVRTRRAAIFETQTIRGAARAVDPRVLLERLVPAATELRGSLELYRAGSIVTGALGVLALVVAAVGFSGVAAFVTEQQMAELAVRRALGARRRNLVWATGRRVFLPVVAGVSLGIVGAGSVASLAAGLVYGVGVIDLPSLVASVGLAAGVLALAALGPVLSALRPGAVFPAL